MIWKKTLFLLGLLLLLGTIVVSAGGVQGTFGGDTIVKDIFLPKEQADVLKAIKLDAIEISQEQCVGNECCVQVYQQGGINKFVCWTTVDTTDGNRLKKERDVAVQKVLDDIKLVQVDRGKTKITPAPILEPERWVVREKKS